MTSSALFRAYIDAALAARMDKNAHQAFLVFLKQLVGFGKAADPLTDSRMAKASGIRKDRVQDAIGKVIAAGLIDVDQRDSGWPTYRIPAVFFGDNRPTRFFTPTLPVDGEVSQRMGDFPNGWGHTDTTPYRDIPITDNTPTVTAEPVACDVGLNPVTEIKKPSALSESDFTALLPALRKLPHDKAVDVLALTQAAILNRSIRASPQQFAGGLIKAATAGTLDTSGLRPATGFDRLSHRTASPAPAVEASNQAQELAHLQRMAALTGIPLDTLLPKQQPNIEG